MLETAVAQQLQDRALRCLTLIPERITHIAALFVLCRQGRCSTQVGLIGEHDKKFRLLAVGSVFYHPRRNLGRRGALFRWAALTDGTRGAERAQRSDGSCQKE